MSNTGSRFILDELPPATVGIFKGKNWDRLETRERKLLLGLWIKLNLEAFNAEWPMSGISEVPVYKYGILGTLSKILTQAPNETLEGQWANEIVEYMQFATLAVAEPEMKAWLSHISENSSDFSI